MEDWKARLFVEYEDLHARIKKLDLFLNRFRPDEVQAYGLMQTQLYVMRAYEQLLVERMKLYGMVKQ